MRLRKNILQAVSKFKEISHVFFRCVASSVARSQLAVKHWWQSCIWTTLAIPSPFLLEFHRVYDNKMTSPVSDLLTFPIIRFNLREPRHVGLLFWFRHFVHVLQYLQVVTNE